MFQWITDQVSMFGYAGIAFLMFLENLFPPIPSELIMPLAGFVAHSGRLALAVVILSGTLGSLLGAWMWYEIGRKLGKERLKDWAARRGRWLGLHPDDFDKTDDWFQRHGRTAVFLGRMVPGIRTLISVPAGFAEMKRLPFLAWSALGSLVWCAVLAIAGYSLGAQYARVESVVDPLSKAVLIGIAALYFYRVITWKTPTRADR